MANDADNQGIAARAMSAGNLLGAEALVGRIVESSPIGIAVIDFAGRYVSVNPAYADIYGYATDELLGLYFTAVFREPERERVLQLHQAFLQQGGAQHGEWEVMRRDGSQLSVMSDSVVLEGGAEQLRLVYVADITPRKISEKQLRISESHFRSLAKALPVGIFRTDAAGQCIYVNERWCEITGLTTEQAQGGGWAGALHHEDRLRVAGKWAACAQNSVPFVDEYRFQCVDGQVRWVLGQAIEEYDAAGRVSGYVGSITDITEYKRLEEDLRQQANTDFLTGLFNRRAFLTRIDEEVARVQRVKDLQVALLMLDLDHFKRVNDQHGHAAGDALLRHFAEQLRSSLRRVDMAGRLGGEEFGIILEGASLADGRQYAERLCQRLADLPLAHAGLSIAFTVSIGVTGLRLSDQAAEAVLARADQALYRVKARGRNGVACDEEAD